MGEERGSTILWDHFLGSYQIRLIDLDCQPEWACVPPKMQGLVFAVAATAGVIKLYDVRSYDKGPFDTFNVSQHALMAARQFA